MIADVLLHFSRLSFIEGGSCYKEKRYNVSKLFAIHDLDVFDLGIKVTYFAFFSGKKNPNNDLFYVSFTFCYRDVWDQMSCNYLKALGKKGTLYDKYNIS